MATAFFFTEDDGTVTSVSCAAFKEDVWSLGSALYSKGFKDGAHVAIVGPNSYEWLNAFFSVTCGGNVAVPLDARQPVENLISLMVRGDCSALVYSKEFEPAAKAVEGAVSKALGKPFTCIPMEGFETLKQEGRDDAAAAADFDAFEVDVNAMCVIVFTSGTTGEPKGVMLSQDNIVANMVQASSNYVQEGTGMAPLPMHHMFGLVVGYLMVYNYRYPAYIVRNMRRVLKDMQTAKPRTLFAVPIILETFLKQFGSMAKRMGGQLTPEMVKQATGGNLKYIICGGAALSVQVVRAFRAMGIEVLNGYGITECSPVLAVNRNEDRCDGSVGPVLFGCEVKIADDGEILARGRNIMLGYYKMPEETAEALEGGWYHTGDLGKIEDHYLFVTGRKKNLIITASGENVSPEEIEEKLLADPAVEEAVVVERGGRLAALVYPAKEAAVTEEYLEALKDKVNGDEPAYRRIQAIELREEPFPRNTTGKIVRGKI